MKIEHVLEIYSESASRLADRVRALSLSGIAVVWVFKTESETGPWIPGELLLPALLFVLIFGS